MKASVSLGPNFIPQPPEVWAVVVGMMQPGIRWQDEAALYDLRWWWDQKGGKLPSRRDLSDRWNWSPDEVRTLLRHPERWMDPRKGATAPVPARASDPAVPRRDPARPKSAQPPTSGPLLFDASDPARPSLTQPDPATPPFVDPQPQPQPQIGQTSTDADDGPRLDPFDQAARYWAIDVAARLGRRPGKPTQRSTKIGRQLLAAVQRDPEELMDAMRLIALGDGGRARFLRGEESPTGGRPFELTLTTVLRHAAEYAEIYRSERDVPKPLRRGEHSSSRKPRLTEAEVLAQNPHAYDDIFAGLEAP